jgi:hypothetical protein
VKGGDLVGIVAEIFLGAGWVATTSAVRSSISGSEATARPINRAFATGDQRSLKSHVAGGIDIERSSLARVSKEPMWRRGGGEEGTLIDEKESMRMSRVLICKVQLLVTRMWLNGFTTKAKTSS